MASRNPLSNRKSTRVPPSVFPRGGSLLPSIYADARYIDAVIVSKANTSHGRIPLRLPANRNCNRTIDIAEPPQLLPF